MQALPKTKQKSNAAAAWREKVPLASGRLVKTLHRGAGR